MRWLALLLVAAAAADAQPRFQRFTQRTPQGRNTRGLLSDSYAFLEFAPASGAGMPAACSSTAPTGAKGEVLTFSRTGNATCLKQGPATTGIANGDLVLLSADVPRVSFVAGLLAFLRESSRTNSLVRSESIDNAAWTKAAGATVTADYATAPDGTSTADRLVYDAVSSYVLGSLSTGGLTYTTSIFLRGTSSSGSIDMCRGGAAGQCVVCSYVADSWSRCVWTHTLASASNFFIGCDVPTKGGACSPAGDVLVWGAQGEAGAWATSYIPTTSAAVVRNADSAMSATLASSVGTSFSLGASTAYLSSSVTTATAVQLGTVAPNLASVGRNSNTAAAFAINATSTTPAVSAQGTSMLRGCLTDAAGTRTAWWDGATVSAPAASMSAGVTALSFGALDAYTARVLVDPSPTRCP